MDPTNATPPYSAIADALDKFHTSSEPIQALWLIVPAATVLGVAYLAMRGVTEIIALLRRPRRFSGDPFDGVYQDVVVRMISAAETGPDGKDLPRRSALAQPALIGRSEA